MKRRPSLPAWRALGRVVVLDLECTCADDGSIPPDRMETIEFGAVLLDLGSGAELDSFHSFVRPLDSPTLSAFCRGLTRIRQEDVDTGPPFPEALEGFLAFLARSGAPAFASWGSFDHLHLRREAKRKKVPYPLREHWNAKAAFRERFELGTEVGLERALAFVGLPFDGQPHRALVDARNTGRLLVRVLEPEATTGVPLASREAPRDDSAVARTGNGGEGGRV